MNPGAATGHFDHPIAEAVIYGIVPEAAAGAVGGADEEGGESGEAAVVPPVAELVDEPPAGVFRMLEHRVAAMFFHPPEVWVRRWWIVMPGGPFIPPSAPFLPNTGWLSLSRPRSTSRKIATEVMDLLMLAMRKE